MKNYASGLWPHQTHRIARAIRAGHVTAAFVIALAMVLVFPGAPLRAQGQASLQIGFFRVTAEVSADPARRARGLMGRTHLPPNHGMLFVFEQDAIQCFWMKNTPLPLSIAFIGADGKIVNIADMAPHSEDQHCSVRPVRYALEMEQGWFRSRGVLTGDPVSGLR